MCVYEDVIHQLVLTTFSDIREIAYTVRVEIFEVFLISHFSWVADDTKIIHVEGGITTREISK